MTSHSRAIRSQSQKIMIFVKFGPLVFLNCERTCGLTDDPASIYDRKMDARPFDTFHDILRCLSLVKSLFKGRNAPILRKWEPTHMRLPGCILPKFILVYYLYRFGNLLILTPKDTKCPQIGVG